MTCVQTYARALSPPKKGKTQLLTLPHTHFSCIVSFGFILSRPPLWSGGQSFWLQIRRSRVRSPALPDFLSSSGSGTGSTQPREVNWGATWLNEKSSGSRSRKQRLTAVGTRCADHVTPLYPQKMALTSPNGGGRSVCRVRVRTKATEFRLVLYKQSNQESG